LGKRKSLFIDCRGYDTAPMKICDREGNVSPKLGRMEGDWDEIGTGEKKEKSGRRRSTKEEARRKASLTGKRREEKGLESPRKQGEQHRRNLKRKRSGTKYCFESRKIKEFGA